MHAFRKRFAPTGCKVVTLSTVLFPHCCNHLQLQQKQRLTGSERIQLQQPRTLARKPRGQLGAAAIAKAGTTATNKDPHSSDVVQSVTASAQTTVCVCKWCLVQTPEPVEQTRCFLYLASSLISITTTHNATAAFNTSVWKHT